MTFVVAGTVATPDGEDEWEAAERVYATFVAPVSPRQAIMESALQEGRR